MNFIVDCIYAEMSDMCPNGYEIPPYFELIPLFVDNNDIFSNLDNSLEICNDPLLYIINCHNYHDQQCSNIIYHIVYYVR